jgi:hypothetical protein
MMQAYKSPSHDQHCHFWVGNVRFAPLQVGSFSTQSVKSGHSIIEKRKGRPGVAKSVT